MENQKKVNRYNEVLQKVKETIVNYNTEKSGKYREYVKDLLKEYKNASNDILDIFSIRGFFATYDRNTYEISVRESFLITLSRTLKTLVRKTGSNDIILSKHRFEEQVETFVNTLNGIISHIFLNIFMSIAAKKQ